MNLEEVAARLEIADVLYRYCRGVDRGELALLQSVYHPDAIDDHGTWKGNGHEFAAYLVESMDRSPHVGQHHITNMLISLQGREADVESYFIAYHPGLDEQTGAPVRIAVGGRYLDRFALRNGQWKIASRKVVLDWTEAPRSDAGWSAQAHFLRGGRRENDPSCGMRV